MKTHENEALELIKRKKVTVPAYIHTVAFFNSLVNLLLAELDQATCMEYIDMYSRFDRYGMDKGTDYSNTHIAFEKPVIHNAFVEFNHGVNVQSP